MEHENQASRVERLFQEWGPTLVRYAYRLVGSREAADDLVQEAFLALYRVLRSGTEVENPRAWTVAVVRNLAVKQHRNQARRPEIPFPTEELVWAVNPGSLCGSEEEDGSAALSLLAVLSMREREVLLLRIEGRKYREIASTLRISQKTVETLLTRALRKLRKSADAQRKGLAVPVHVEGHVPKTLQ